MVCSYNLGITHIMIAEVIGLRDGLPSYKYGSKKMKNSLEIESFSL